MQLCKCIHAHKNQTAHITANQLGRDLSQGERSIDGLNFTSIPPANLLEVAHIWLIGSVMGAESHRCSRYCPWPCSDHPIAHTKHRSWCSPAGKGPHVSYYSSPILQFMPLRHVRQASRDEIIQAFSLKVTGAIDRGRREKAWKSRLILASFPLPFPACQCMTIRLCSQATPTVKISCEIYSRATFIHSSAVFVQHLFDKIWYNVVGSYTMSL